MFKMLENSNQLARPLNDPKLMIYDVLKAKHKAFKKEQQGSWAVSEQEFMEYSPLQVMGMIELNGGFSKLTEVITAYEREQN